MPPYRAEHIGSLLRPKALGFARMDAIGEVDLQHDDAGNKARIGDAPCAVAKVRRAGPIVADEVAFAARLESARDLEARVAEASRYVPLERLAISPQCGFASRDLGTALTFSDQEAKLRLVVETAARVWQA